MNLVAQKLMSWFVKPFLEIYLRKKRKFKYLNLEIEVFPTVFHPQFFYSTKFLLRFISKLDLEGKKLMEPGCGSGIISLFACSKGANVVASDIHPVSVENTKHNFTINLSKLGLEPKYEILVSNLFDAIEKNKFDYVIINPPYFFKDPINDGANAWYCGKNGEYFYKLFEQLHDFINSTSKTYMVLAENCDIERIKKIGIQNRFNLKLIETRTIWWEKNYIFQVTESPIIYAQSIR